LDPTKVNKENNIHHIDFVDDEGDGGKKNGCSQFIAREYILNGIPTQENT
jgi:hypothetical protein